MGSVSRIIEPGMSLRPFLIDAVERGIRHALERSGDDLGWLADPLAR